MDKEKAKRAAALSAAAAVGSIGGSFGADVIIDKKSTDNDSPEEDFIVEVVNEDNVQDQLSPHALQDFTEDIDQTIMVDPLEPEEPLKPEELVELEEQVELVELGEPVELEEPLYLEEPLEPEEPAEPVEPVEPEEPVESEEPIFIDDPLGPIQDDVLMYGGPGMCDNMIYPEPVMYGGPNDDLYVNDIEGV